MQRKQSALLAKHDKDGSQQVSSHIEQKSVGLGIYDDLPTAGNQVACNALNRQEILGRGREAIRINLNRARQMVRHLPHPNNDWMRRSALLLYERQFGECKFRQQSNPADQIHSSNLFHSLSPKSVSRDYSKLTFRV